MLNCFHQIVVFKFDFTKKFREINFSFNFTLHRYFSKMNYVNTFFPSFLGAEGLGGFCNVSKMNYVDTFFPSFFGAEGLGEFCNVSKMNYVNIFFQAFLTRFSLLSIAKMTRRFSQLFHDEQRKRIYIYQNISKYYKWDHTTLK